MAEKKRNRHRSSGLDIYLNKKVFITFNDKTEKRGILRFSEEISESNFFVPKDYYYLVADSGVTYAFRKTSVKEIVEIM